ncbi:MAG: LemA family protein [Bacteroidaceae bacterium]|nr:LemA family protein [Bacteroidaceae bacterium]
MKKRTIVLIVVVALLAIWGISGYNSLVNSDEAVSKAWSDVETQYQRRSDLIPNLVNVVKGYAKHEEGTLMEVTEARTKATSIQLDPTNLTEEDLRRFQEVQSQVGSALGRLIAVAESYPELKANENFSELQAQLEGTENRIQKSRADFNEVVREYNTSVRRFPGNILAGMFGFDVKANFKADEGSEKAPSVEF